MTESQLDLVLPPRPANEILREELADLVTDFNTEADPMARAILHGRIRSLRRLLGIERAETRAGQKRRRS